MRRAALALALAALAGPAAAAAPWRVELVPGAVSDAPAPGFAAAATIEELPALLRAQRARAGPDLPIEVVARGGTYRLAAPLQLGPNEAPPGAGLVLSAAPGATVTFSGAVPVAGLVPMTDEPGAERLSAAARASVLVATLPPDWRQRWGELRPRGMGMAGQPAHAELFHRGALLPLARWPDAGIALVAATPDGKEGQRFVAADSLPPGLGAEPDLWAFGFWGADWAPSHLPVQALEAATNTVTLPARGIRYGIRERAPFQLENALSVLDRPGEWYLDRGAGRLFVWPPAELAPGDLELSLTETLLELTDAADVTVTGLGFAAARGDAVVIAGGSGNRLAECTIRNIGNVAVRLGGRDSEVTDCTITDIGDSAVVLDGGDRPSLTPGRLALTGSHIHDYGRWTRAYTAGAMLHGVGNRVAGNIIGRAPHMGIQIHGNDHVVEGNLLHDLVRATNDAGAIYIWGDWAQRGHVIRDNTICRVNAPTRFAIGIYLDLFASGIVIEGNRLFDVHWGILLNGGSDNLVRGNIVVGGEYPIRFDAIGLSWSRAPVLDPNSHLRRPLAQLPIDGPLWRGRYPGLATVLEGDPGMPKRNVFAGNRIYGSAMARFDTKAAAHTSLEGNTHAPQASAADLKHWFPALCRP